jgi:hypothetical protein
MKALQKKEISDGEIDGNRKDFQGKKEKKMRNFFRPKRMKGLFLFHQI